MFTNILRTKLYIPRIRPSEVLRSGLIERLNKGRGCRLTLLSAPAGYGKSTLLSEWVHQSKLPVAWISLEKADNNLVRFWTYVVSALQTLPTLRGDNLSEILSEFIQEDQPSAQEIFLTRLVSEITEIDERFILILDDLHLVADSGIHEGLTFFIDHLPPSSGGMHLVVSSRVDPPWPMARWRLQNEINEIRTRDLRFSYEETDRFLNQVLKLNLSAPDIIALQERTEGWIAGLHLAALSIQARLNSQDPEGISRFISTFTGTNRFVLDYLVEEVIGQQPEEIQEFLYKTSILEQLSASLCDTLLERSDSQGVLESLEQANLFLIPLDDDRRWYRYHHLFGRILQKYLKEKLPDQITRLHQRASEWYAKKDHLPEAISHALTAGDLARVNEFVSGNALAMIDHVELYDVLRRFEELPEFGRNTTQNVNPKPWLDLAYAWVKAYADPSEEIGKILTRVEQDAKNIENALERRRLDTHVDAIRAYVAWVKGESEKALKFTRNALRNLAEDDWSTRAHLLNIQGLAMNYLDNLPMAAKSYQAAIHAGQKTGRFQETFFAYTNLAFVILMQGKLHQAYNLCQQALQLANEFTRFSSQAPILAYAYATMSMVQLEWNDLEAALTNAWKGVTLAERWNQADALHFALTCLSKALCASGNLEEAFKTNQRAMQLALKVSDWFVRLSICDEIWLNLVKGDIRLAEEKFSQLDSLVEEKTKEKGTFLVTKVSLLNAQGNSSGVLSAIHGPDARYENEGNIWCLLNLLSHKALALQALGDEATALEEIAHCLALAQPEGFIRVFLECGAPMAKLLQTASSKGIQTEYINRLLPRFILPITQPSPGMPVTLKVQYPDQSSSLIEPLSERELQVLHLLNSSLTSDEIAEELYVAVSTIRTHIRNIYGKLDAHSRIEAVQKARELKLV